MSAQKILPEHKEMILDLKKRGLSNGQVYIQYMSRFIQEKHPIEGVIAYDTMVDIIRRNKLKA